MRQRVEERGPSGHNRSLFGLALDPKGERLAFEDGAERMDLELVDSTAIPSGVAILTYRPQR